MLGLEPWSAVCKVSTLPTVLYHFIVPIEAFLVKNTLYIHVYVHVCAHMCLRVPSTYTWTCMVAPSLMAPLWGPAYLIHMVERGALVRPVSVTLFDPILHQRCEHDNDAAATFPHHLGMTPRRRCGQQHRTQKALSHPPLPQSPPARSPRWCVTAGLV